MVTREAWSGGRDRRRPASSTPSRRSPPTSLSRPHKRAGTTSPVVTRREDPSARPPCRGDDARAPVHPEPAPGRPRAHGPAARVSGSRRERSRRPARDVTIVQLGGQGRRRRGLGGPGAERSVGPGASNRRAARGRAPGPWSSGPPWASLPTFIHCLSRPAGGPAGSPGQRHSRTPGVVPCGGTVPAGPDRVCPRVAAPGRL